MNIHFFSSFYDTLWSKDLKRNNILNVKFDDESTEAFQRNICSLHHNKLFQEYNKSTCGDISSPEEYNYMMENSEFQEHGEFDFEYNLKEKSPTLKHYDNIHNNKNLYNSLKKLYSKDVSPLCYIKSSNKFNFSNYINKMNGTIIYNQNNQGKSIIVYLIYCIAVVLIVSIIIGIIVGFIVAFNPSS
ncbi:hypothetical protein MKS88_001252 [Plasmodium brasilianum]|uniref:Uncharacterized protein n=1 Tax=Plasmodium brasilianum TaxID=5824 RepID=A0ACB9YEB7_PLABR|nr:hypothetical protein MKS88_001252 [Plasmodium brasilianum]